MTLASIIWKYEKSNTDGKCVCALHLNIFHTKYGGSHARKCLRNVDFI